MWFWIWQAIAPDKATILLIFLLIVVRSAMDVLAPWPIKIVVDSVLGHRRTMLPFHTSHRELLALMAGLMAMASLIGMGSAYKAYQLLARVNQAFAFRLRNRMLRHVLKMPVGDMERWAPGELLARLMSDSLQVSNGLTQSAAQIFTGVVTLVGILTMISAFMPIFSVLVIVGVGGLGFLVFYVTRSIRRRTRVVRRLESQALGLAMEHLKSLRVVLSLRMEATFRRRFRRLIDQSR
ncbi:MAG: ABC transporter transmembrane domain-containing protein [Sulfobacillus sp.]|nr:ABC transporter transmembrane domain-containing protein [Sulfobacillus sp.]